MKSFFSRCRYVATVATLCVCYMLQAEELPTTPNNAQSTPTKTQSPPPSAAPPVSKAVLNARIDRALQTLNQEPSLQELADAALKEADLEQHRPRKWQSRSKLQALLPDIKLDADCDIGRDEDLDRYQEKPDRWGADTERGYRFGASVQWKLSELVFNTDELKVFDTLTDLASRRETLLSLIVGYYYERRRLQLTLILQPPRDMMAMMSLRMRIDELSAAIDALTGGRLTRRLFERGSPPK